MKFSQFFSGQRVIKQVLDWLQNTKGYAITERMADTFQDGVVENNLNNMAIIGKDVDGTLTDFFHIKVQTGVAYKTGERILIDNESITYDATNISDTTDDGSGNLISTPHSTGSFNIPLTATFINYLYIAYLQTTDETAFTTHKITGLKQFYKRTDGYQIVVNTTGINPDSSQYIFLGQVDLTGSNQAITSNISIVNRDIYRTQLRRVGIQTNNVGLTDRPAAYATGNVNLSLDDHIKSVGTGPVTPFNPHGLSPDDLGLTEQQRVEAHRRNEHVNGIIGGVAGAPLPTTSALFVERVQQTYPAEDFLHIKPLLSTEYALVYGTAYGQIDFPLELTLTFSSDPTGTYQIYLDSTTNTIGKTTSSISADDTKLWLGSVDWDSGTKDLSIVTERRRFGTTNRLQRWVTTSRPSNPIEGNYGYNLDVHKYEYYNGSSWVQL